MIWSIYDQYWTNFNLVVWRMYLKSILYLGNIISQGGMITEAALRIVLLTNSSQNWTRTHARQILAIANRISNIFLWRTHELFIGSSVKSRLWFNLSLPPLYIYNLERSCCQCHSTSAMKDCRPVVPGGAPPNFDRSVNPISTKRGRLCPPNNTAPPNFHNLWQP